MPNRTQPQISSYPESTRSDHVDVQHGTPVLDPYRWLEEIDSPETRQWIEAQNQVTSEHLDTIADRERVGRRISELWDHEKYGLPWQFVPVKRGGRYVFARKEGLQNQSVLYWTESIDAEPRVLVDPNALAEDGTVAISGYAVSKDGRYVAYGLSASGSDWQELRCREVASGKDLPDHVKWVKFCWPSWAPDGEGFFYSRYDEPAEGMTYKGANYYHKLYHHRLGTSQTEDRLVYERPDQKAWMFSGEVSDDGRYLIISIWDGNRRENGIFYQDLAAGGKVVELLNEFDAKYTFIGNDGPIFYIKTSRNAPMSRVIAIDLNDPDPASWREIISEQAEPLEEIHYVNGCFAAVYLQDAQSLVKICDRQGQLLRDVELPDIGSVMGFEGQADDPETFFYFTGFSRPGEIHRYDMETGESRPLWRPKVDFDPDAFVTRQIFYASKDGTRAPLFICHKKGLTLNGDAPTLLSGYGGFNISKTPGFAVENIAWMELGGVYATAVLRGGGEYGESWHEAGMKQQKQNVFDDFIAAAEWLIENNYTSTSKLAIEGRSNGGLLVGACLTQRPELFGACLPGVGVLDMLRFHQFTIGWAWAAEYGSPDEPGEFEALRAYSPYHNIRSGVPYPATLITTGDHDDRVFPAHSYKFAAALQAAQGGSAPILIRIDTKAGHGSGKPTAKVIDEMADKWAFLIRHLDVTSE